MSETGRSAAKKDTNDTADVKELQQAFSLFNDPEVTKLRLADHFPIVLPGCKEQAAKFFHCFTLNSRGLHQHDKEAPLRGMKICQKLMEEYDTCTRAALAKKK
eukprot:TRINITY_DN3933_c0_g1_i2.p1 TRINITY_DN3933_c0_g1~~TRINITY_DN3933_c0_g1_i2.p1  ORF type:complete len:103 (-),score=34.82 TRINITY_DN3933_c0_g1_i2:84-392(-)